MKEDFYHVRGLHLIKQDENLIIAYDPENHQVVNLRPTLYQALREFHSGANLEALMCGEYPAEPIFSRLEDHLREVSEKLVEKWRAIEAQKEGLRTIGRITLHVSNDCNLRCSYCYAQGGAYGIARGNMTVKTAKEVSKFLIDRFDIVEHIAFFGGEPLMNPNAIEAVCESMTEAYNEGRLKALPSFGLITNGTLLDQRRLDLIKRYISGMTISVDGPPELHDFNRKTREGGGSYEMVDRFIRTIQTETDVDVRFEGTISREHVRQGFGTVDLAKYMKREYGLTGSVAPDILSEDKKSVVVDLLAEEESLSEGRKILDLDQDFFYSSGMDNLLPALVNGMLREMCPVGQNIISISIKGELYACHICVGKEHLRFGSIYGENIFDQEDIYLERFPFLRSVRKETKACQECWMRRLCGGCTIRWYFKLEEERFLDTPPRSLCLRQEKDFETMLLALARTRNDPKLWKEFLEMLGSNDRVSAC